MFALRWKAEALRCRGRCGEVGGRLGAASAVNQTIECSAGICDNSDYCSLGHQADGGSTMTRLGEIKRDRSCNRRWLLRDGILALPFILAIRPARAVERVGSVDDVTGEAFAELEQVRRTL